MKYSQIRTHYEIDCKTAWCYMRGQPRPCFTPTLLREGRHYFEKLSAQTKHDIRYMVLASDVPGVYNLGGDLDLFRTLITRKDEEGLYQYAKACIDLLYLKMVGFKRDITHITLVQGAALGGGFECALASHVLIAERRARMGLPEILFNLFPGMGAYSFLSRKLGPVQAQEVILSGKIYSAEELRALGIVDLLAEDGQGVLAAYDYIKRESKTRNGYLAMRKVRNYLNPVSYEELIHVAKIWVEAALRIKQRDLRMMERLISRQTHKSIKVA